MISNSTELDLAWTFNEECTLPSHEITGAEGWLLDTVLGNNQPKSPVAPAHAPASRPANSFHPESPGSLADTGLTSKLIVGLALKYLLHVGKASGREIARQIRLPFRVLDDLLKTLRDEQVISYTRSSGVGDFEYLLTEQGRFQAKQLQEQSTYMEAAPVPLEEYIASVKQQSLSGVRTTPEKVLEAFQDLTLAPQMVRRVGQALAGSATMLLFGNPGNGKTSIAERLIKPFADTIWIPRAITVDGDIIRLFDAAVHHEVALANPGTYDERWVQVQRPIVIVGGELTLESLEPKFNPSSHTYEAPLQLKSNCGVLLIDDFGRQKVDPEQLLNRWIVPLEKRVDYLDLSNGKRVCVPFEQMLVFSTNLRPADVVDEAFLRRITYKVEVPDPTEEQFRAVFVQVARKMQLEIAQADLDDLIERHYRMAHRPLRFCHPRDLLQQVSTACEFTRQQRQATPELLEDAVLNYFCVT